MKQCHIFINIKGHNAFEIEFVKKLTSHNIGIEKFKKFDRD